MCIHLYENREYKNGSDSTLLELDVSNLFANDLQTLNRKELAGLKLIAEKAPADWSEIIEISGVATLNNLIAKRLVIRSGDRLNVYWDIFRDYLVSGTVPVVPFNYVPSTGINAMLKVSDVLEGDRFQTSISIAQKTGLKERTVWNIGADLVLFGVAERNGTSFKFHRVITEGHATEVLSRIREKVDKHSLKIDLYRNYAGQTIAMPEVLSALKDCLPSQKLTETTCGVYANRFVNIFVQLGFLTRSGLRFTVQDAGSVASRVSRRARKSEVFTAMASPASVCDALELLGQNSDVTVANSLGYRNSLAVLKRFNLIEVENGIANVNGQALGKFGGIPESVWTSAKNEVVIIKCIEALKRNENLSGVELGSSISDEFSLNWTDASKARTGNALKQWSKWIIEGSDAPQIPEPPGRKKNTGEVPI